MSTSVLAHQLQKSHMELLSEIRKIAKIYKRNPDSIRILTVTKKQTEQSILALYHIGMRLFGESTVQEAYQKFTSQLFLPCNAIELHLIGTLQKNKIKKALTIFSCIQSIDSISLTEELLDVYFLSLNTPKTKNVFFQINLTGEMTKHGFEDFIDLKEAAQLLNSTNTLGIRGLMCIGPHTNNINYITSCFRETRIWAERLKKELKLSKPLEISMGMSNDFPIAIKEGATMLRIGTALFGKKT